MFDHDRAQPGKMKFYSEEVTEDVMTLKYSLSERHLEVW